MNNWNIVKQALIDDMSSFLRDFSDKALSDIQNRLVEKGLNKSKIEKSKVKITYITDDDQEYATGQVYFEEVDKEISHKSWPETIV